MRALSLWQPWASAVALGWKKIETRHWATAYRGPLAIHAAKRWTREEREEWEIACEIYGLPDEPPPLGAIVAIAVLSDIRRSEDLQASISPEEREWGNYGPRRFGWILTDIVKLLEPVPFRGAQGLFDVPNEVFGPGYVPPPIAPKRVEPPRQGALFA